MKLYHGSKIGGIKYLKPHKYGIVDNKNVVFATDDIRFALAMIYGTGDEIAVGYFVNQDTREEEMYIDELQKGKLKLLDNKGFVYEVESAGFVKDDRLSHVEYINENNEVKVLNEVFVPNILNEIKKYKISIVEYKGVLKEIEKRGRQKENPRIKYEDDRFK